MVELQTPLTRQLGIEVPIFSAGIGSAAGPELVAAVSNAGGFGVLGASAYNAASIGGLIARTRALTDRPFGVNIIIDDRDLPGQEIAELRDQVSAAIRERPAALVLFWGDPRPYVAEAHDNGVKLFTQVGSVEEAETAVAAGVDAVIAQGIEAGGHVRGTTPIWTLLPATVAAVTPRPVLASGGIGDGAGIARALQLGAQAVSLGTRFVASDEAFVHPAYKRRIVDGKADDTILNELYDVWWPNAPHRTLRNKTSGEWEAAGRPTPGQRPGEGTPIGKRRLATGDISDWPRYAIGVATPDFDGDVEYAPLWAGESCSVVNDIRPAGELVRDLARDAANVLASVTA